MSVSAIGSNNRFTCLVVEDDSAFAAMAAKVVSQQGGEPTLAPTLADAHRLADNGLFDLVLLDNHLPDGKGYDFFEQFSRKNRESPVIMITGVPDLADAVTLTRNGLFDYLTKPISVEALEACIGRARQRLKAGSKASGESNMLGESPVMLEIQKLLRQAARHPESTVLLTGETGTGKDLAARVLHQMTFPAGNAPFVPLNCGAIPSDIFESELFGAERGAYTGSEKRRSGLVGAAAGGTLFLDEIAEVPLPLQGKLLRLLESREYRSLGSSQNLPFTGRFVTATNKSLASEVQAGRFREDLLYRLDVFTIELPPLRKRQTDIPALAELLLTELSKKYGRARPHLKPNDLRALTEHSFPGNIRELRNILERSLLKTDEEEKWLALDRTWENRRGFQPVSAPPATTPAAQPAAFPPERQLSPIEAQEYQLIRQTLRETKGGIRRAASKLGLSPQALLRRLEKWPELRETST